MTDAPAMRGVLGRDAPHEAGSAGSPVAAG